VRWLVASLLLVAAPASADVDDLVLSRLAVRQTDAMGNLTGVVPDQVSFRALSSQLGVVLAPHNLTPADTLGFGGLQFSVDASTTTIDQSAPYWRALEGTPPTSMRTLGFFVRKGLWLPIPSFEIGAGAVHLVDSNIWAGQLYTKFGLQEGYHQLPLPSFAVRGAVSRMMNQRELDLTVASIDIEVSKHVGIGGTWRLDPFAGWNILMIIPRSQVLDPTPNVDGLANPDDGKLNFVFHDQANIYRQRLFLGTKLQYYVFQLSLEAEFAFAGSSVDNRGTGMDCTLDPTTTNCDTKDIAKAQTTLSLSAGFDF